MDIRVTYPAPGQIHLHSDFLFADPSNELCKEFVRRTTESAAVTRLTILSARPAKRRSRRRRAAVAEVHYCTKSRSLKQAVAELYERLLGDDAGNFYYNGQSPHSENGH